MDELTERPQRQAVAHHVFGDRRFTPFVVEPVSVPPKAIGTYQLLVYKLDGRPPARDVRLPTQRDPKQAQPVVDYGPTSHRDRLRSEDAEAQLRRGNALEVGRIGEEGEHPFARQRQPHGRLENVKRHAPYCSSLRCWQMSGRGGLVEAHLRWSGIRPAWGGPGAR